MTTVSFHGTALFAIATTLAATTLAAPPALAQGTTPAALATVTLSPAAAKKAMTSGEINASTAEQLVNACVDYSASRNAGASVVVLSASGYIVHAHRTDGQMPNNMDSAYEKAKTALYMRASTHEVANRWSKAEELVARSNVHLYPLPGGLPIVVSDQLIGAIGVGGASVGDEQCAYEALTKVLGPQPALAPTKP
jgi:uncharacterized protein GlcG (DUF336 family)